MSDKAVYGRGKEMLLPVFQAIANGSDGWRITNEVAELLALRTGAENLDTLYLWLNYLKWNGLWLWAIIHNTSNSRSVSSRNARSAK